MTNNKKIDLHKSDVGGDQTGEINTTNVDSSTNISITNITVTTPVIENTPHIESKTFKKKAGFVEFLNSTEMLNSFNINRSFLDLWINIDLFDIVDEKTFNLQDLIENFSKHRNILINGDSESSKTSSIKYIMHHLPEDSILVYLDMNVTEGRGNITKKIEESLKKNYENPLHFDDMKKLNIYLFVDNFDRISPQNKNHEKFIKQIEELEMKYPHLHCILTSNKQLHELSIEMKTITISFVSYSIKPIGLRHRELIINRWLEYKNIKDEKQYEIQREEYIQKLNDLVIKSLVPNTVFFVYTLIYMSDNAKTQNITNYKYCYETILNTNLEVKALIPNELVTGYTLFLTYVCYYLFEQKKQFFNEENLKLIFDEYPFEIYHDFKTVLKNIVLSGLIVESIGEYSFRHDYIYYYLLGSYFADNYDEQKDKIKQMILNLQDRTNSYSIIFLTYHRIGSKMELFQQLTDKIDGLFDSYPEVTLTQNEISSLEIAFRTYPEIDFISIPDIEKTRERHLRKQEELGELEELETIESVSTEVKIVLEFIRTIEVMGCILKNNPLTIHKPDKDKYFSCAIKSIQRFVGALVGKQTKDNGRQIYDYLTKNIQKYVSSHPDESNGKYEQKEIVAKMYATLIQSIYSAGVNISVINLCSKYMFETIDRYQINNNSPFLELMSYVAKMQYNKEIKQPEIEKLLNHEESSFTLDKLVHSYAHEYCQFHRVDVLERQKLGNLFENHYKSKQEKISVKTLPINHNSK